MLQYLFSVLKETGLQLLILFGPLLIPGFLMHFISGRIERISIRLLGTKGYFMMFAWLGTSVHELGHAIFAVLFGHRIEEMKLFSPDPKTGTLGYVKHSWNKKNLFHVTGNFFIGIGPVILGTFMLFLVIWLLYGFMIGRDFTVPADNLTPDGLLFSVLHQMKELSLIIFSGPSSTWWKTIVLAFILLSIGGSVKLSPPDIAGAINGFLIIILIILILNLATFWSGSYVTLFFIRLSGILAGFFLLLVISLIINLFFLVVLSLLYLVRIR